MSVEKSKDIIVFQHPSEIFERPDFDEDASISIDQFESFIGVYLFQDDMICQVSRKGKHCHQKHRHGWVFRRCDGVEVIAGCDCAKNHFGADKSFRIQLNRANEAYDRIMYSRKLENYRQLGGHVISQINMEQDRLSSMWRHRVKIAAHFNNHVISQIKNMEKTARRQVVIKVGYIEKDEDGNEKHEWINQDFGRLHHTVIFNDHRFAQFRKRLGQSLTSWHESAVAGSSPKVSDMKRWVRHFDDIANCVSELDEFERNFDRFCSPENVSVLCAMTRNNEYRRKIAELQFLPGNRKYTKKQITEFLDTVEQAILERTHGRKYRLAG
ncbi:hypothetical protein [Marinobacter similis]|uniref:Uncharacterized protein n=1 Tax=Marinobacter similis TaxID=1420916 RepID=W5YU45_9GAMM|nr:hypothetical protein [Marinobacter similis]AHI29988.1 hypothetical protein AU14_03410 [Marinobacter similis]